jgi:tRNA-Thr(GGU) m(6)t(6)A37 methyltransferase TsaA
MSENTPTNMTEDLQLTVIGKVSSPYKEKFAIARQPSIVSAAKGQIILQGTANHHELVRGLEQFSHIWVIFIFHACQQQGWKPLVRPPRLGGNKKMGVLATRSTFRPNPIGLSVVKLDAVSIQKNNVVLDISGLDLLDGTPVVDIKPYLPYADAISDAAAGFAQNQPVETLSVTFSDKARQNLLHWQAKHAELEILLVQILSQDPRPAYKADQIDHKVYGIHLFELNIQWRVITLTQLEVIAIDKA